MPSKSLKSPHAPSDVPRMVGRYSDKIRQSLQESEKQLRRAEEKRARRGAVRIEAAARGQIAASPALEDLLFVRDAVREQEITHLGPDQ